VNVLDFPKRKADRDRLVMVTCYDATFAAIIADCPVDMILVGDSAAMVMHGHDSTLPMEVGAMAAHVAAVRRGAPDVFIVADLPFLAHRRGLEPAMEAVAAVMRAGANAVKLEGIRGHEELVRHVVESGVPVMGHLGLTPQAVHQLGGYRVQGREDRQRERLRAEAKACEQAGCFALVLECVPESLAAEITRALDIPTIGIGAGVDVDGQVLVLQDLLGLTAGRRPRFVREYLDGRALVSGALTAFAEDVRAADFPAPEERYQG
jgi:3-methyl-2-oxobutanoate hydroxymethyltransferase